MKGRSFRNKDVGSRLREASAAWRDASPNNCFKKKPRRHFGIEHLGYGFLIILLHVKVLGSEKDFIPTLTFLLPLVAGITFSSLFARYVGVRYDERSVLLPLSSAQVHREILREWRNGIVVTLLWILFLGYFLNCGASPWVGPVKCLLLFLSMTAFMSLSLLPFMSWLTSAVFWIFGGLLFFIYIGPFGDLLTEQVATSLPWFVALTDAPESWVIVGGMILSGIAAALATKHHWLSRPDFDCTRYYENLSGFSLEDLENIGLDEETLEESLPTPPPSPKGALESFIWRFFSPREKVLTRATGLCSEKFLSRWLFVTVALVALSYFWQRYSDWDLLYPNIFAIVSLLWLFFSFTLKSDHYFTAIEISPNCAAASFAVLPIGLKTVEKLFYKEGLPKWACLSLTIALIFETQSQGSTPFLNIGILYLLIFLGLALSHSILFWATGTTHWLSNKKRWRYSIGASLCFLGIVLLTISQFISFFAEFWAFGDLSGLRSVSYSLAASIILFLIARALVILRINDPKCDLLNQTEQ